METHNIFNKNIKNDRSLCGSMVEQRPPKPKVEGSIPFTDVFIYFLWTLKKFKNKGKPSRRSSTTSSNRWSSTSSSKSLRTPSNSWSNGSKPENSFSNRIRKTRHDHPPLISSYPLTWRILSLWELIFCSSLMLKWGKAKIGKKCWIRKDSGGGKEKS